MTFVENAGGNNKSNNYGMAQNGKETDSTVSQHAWFLFP